MGYNLWPNFNIQDQTSLLGREGCGSMKKVGGIEENILSTLFQGRSEKLKEKTIKVFFDLI